jgi:hypothetical protein
VSNILTRRALLRCIPVLVLALPLIAGITGCSTEQYTAEVKGLVTVNGQIPMNGSSINFVSLDGKSPSAGCTLVDGRYTTMVTIGQSKVEIRVPRVQGVNPDKKAKNAKGKAKAVRKEGPGAGPEVGEFIEESLPPEYHEKSNLTFDVKSGKNEKDWDIQTKK